MCVSECADVLPDSFQSLRHRSHCGCCNDTEHRDEHTWTSDSETTALREAAGNTLLHTPAHNTWVDREEGQL